VNFLNKEEKLKELNSMFDNMTDEEFEKTIKDAGFSYKKVKKGEGVIL